MFKVLGKEALYLDIANVWKTEMLAHATADDEKTKKFREIVSASEVTYMLNPISEEHTFFIKLADEITPEEIQILADVALDILKGLDCPCISADDVVQRYQVVISNWHEPEIIGKNKTPGMSSGEVFKPIIQGLDAPGRMNQNAQNQYF